MSVQSDITTGADPKAAALYSRTEHGSDYERAMRGVRHLALPVLDLARIEAADAVLIVGADPRVEAPLLNTRLRKIWLAGKAEIALIGEQVDLSYDYNWLGAGSKTLSKLPKAATDMLSKAERPAIIVGAGVLLGRCV